MIEILLFLSDVTTVNCGYYKMFNYRINVFPIANQILNGLHDWFSAGIFFYPPLRLSLNFGSRTFYNCLFGHEISLAA